MVLFVFGQIVIALLTLCTLQSNLSTHLVTSVIFCSKNLGIKKRPNSSLNHYNTYQWACQEIPCPVKKNLAALPCCAPGLEYFDFCSQIWYPLNYIK